MSELDQLRLSATRSLFERRDVVIVSSVSCIYGLGSPEAYYGMLMLLERGQKIRREDITRRLVEILYERNDVIFDAEHFVSAEMSLRFSPPTMKVPIVLSCSGMRSNRCRRSILFSAPSSKNIPACPSIQKAIMSCSRNAKRPPLMAFWKSSPCGKRKWNPRAGMVEAQRIHQRTRFDLEMIKSMGYCHGIENYSRHFSGRLPGEPHRRCWTISRRTICCLLTNRT